jgi:hypothetical protein
VQIPKFARRFLQSPAALEKLAAPFRKGLATDSGDVIISHNPDGTISAQLSPAMLRQLGATSLAASRATGAVAAAVDNLDIVAANLGTTYGELGTLRDSVDQSFPYDFDVSSATTHNVVTLVMPAGKTKFFVNRLVFECKTTGTGVASTATVVLKRSGGGNIFNAQTIPAAAQVAGQYVRISNVGVAVDVCSDGDIIQLQVTGASGKNSTMTLYILGSFV